MNIARKPVMYPVEYHKEAFKVHLFLCYINDMKISVSCKLLLYADDSTVGPAEHVSYVPDPIVHSE